MDPLKDVIKATESIYDYNKEFHPNEWFVRLVARRIGVPNAEFDAVLQKFECDYDLAGIHMLKEYKRSNVNSMAEI